MKEKSYEETHPYLYHDDTPPEGPWIEPTPEQDALAQAFIAEFWRTFDINDYLMTVEE